MRRCWPGGAVASRVRARRWAGRTSRRARPSSRRHAAGTSLALAAPLDQLFTATEINEWAFCAALVAADPGSLETLDDALIEAARSRRRAVADVRSVCSRAAGHRRAGRVRAVREAVEASKARRGCAHWSLRPIRARLSYLVDDDDLTLGSGASGRTWPLDASAERASRCRGASCATCPPRSSPARTARRRRFDCSRRARARTAGATATTAPTVCSSPASRSRAATTPARSGRAGCCATRACKPRFSRPRAAESCGAGSRYSVRASRSSRTSRPITSASTASTTSRGSPTRSWSLRARSTTGGCWC